MAQPIELGDKVQDIVSKIEGIVIGRSEWLYGCVRLTIQAEGEKDGKPCDPFTVDAPQCKLMTRGVILREPFAEAAQDKRRTGGPRADADSRHEAVRR